MTLDFVSFVFDLSRRRFIDATTSLYFLSRYSLGRGKEKKEGERKGKRERDALGGRRMQV